MKNHKLLLARNWSFKSKLLVIISALIIFIIMLISSFSYAMYSRHFTNETIKQTQQIIEQVSINVDTYMNELYRLTLSPYYNDSIMKELETQLEGNIEQLDKKRNIEAFLSSVMTLPRSEILRVYILTDSDLYSYTRTPYDMENYHDYAKTPWYQQAKVTSLPIFIPVHSEKVFGDKKTQIFSIAQRIRSKEDNSKVLAVIKVDSNYDGIKSICDQVQLQDKGSLFIVDENQNILYQNNKLLESDLLSRLNINEASENGNYIRTIENEEYIINAATLKSTNLKVIVVNSYSELNKRSILIRNTTIMLASICALLAVSLLFLFVQNFFKPLFNIINLMKEVQQGNLDVQTEIANNDEVGYLGRSFNKMVLQIKEMLEKNTLLVKEIYESRFLQKEAQYNNLCSQIRPHFLYNTLNTISLQIKCNENEDALHSIEHLSYYLRGIMNGDKNIKLSSEVDIVTAYLGIQKARFGNSLNYHIDLSPEVQDYMIPALTLQPIVENAVIHGCEVKRGEYTIVITNEIQDNKLILSVSDNGIGIEPTLLNTLNEKLSSSIHHAQEDSTETITESIGLDNVNKRIKLHYGEAYGLQMFSQTSQGTKVIVTLPYDSPLKERLKLCTLL